MPARARRAASRWPGEASTSPTAAINASAAERPNQAGTPLAHDAIGDLPLIAPAGHHHHRHPREQRLGHHSVPTPADHQIRLREQFVLPTESDDRPRRHRLTGLPSGQPGHHHPRASRQRLPRNQRLERQLGETLGPSRRRRRGDDHHGPAPLGHLEHRRRGLEVQRADDDGLGRPVRTRYLQRRQGGNQAPPRPGVGCGQPDADACRRALFEAHSHRTCRQRAHHAVAEPAAHTDAWRQPAAQRREPLRRSVQRMRVQLDPRHTKHLGGQPAAGGDHVGDHQVDGQVANRRLVQDRHPGCPAVHLGA